MSRLKLNENNVVTNSRIVKSISRSNEKRSLRNCTIIINCKSNESKKAIFIKNHYTHYY